MHIQNTVNFQNIVYKEPKTICNRTISELEAYSEPYQISIMEHFAQNLVTLAYSQPEEYSESCQASMGSIFLRSLCNSGIFRTLAYSKPEEH